MDQLGLHFDLLARSEDPIVANGYGKSSTGLSADGAYSMIAERLIEYLSPLEDIDRLLEVGCGTGEILCRLAAEFRHAKGLDISPKMVERAQSRGLDVSHYDGTLFPFESSTFSVILIYQVLVNAPTIKRVGQLISEAWRCLEPGGVIYLGALPHPKWSTFPEHRSRRGLRARLASQFAGGALTCYSISWKDLLSIADRLGAIECHVFRSPISLEGWSSKYDFVLRKKAN